MTSNMHSLTPLDRTSGRVAWLVIVLVSAFGTVAHGDPDSPPEDTVSPRLTIDRLYSLPSLIGTEPRGFAWSSDSSRLAFLWNDAGYNFRDVWLLDTEDPKLEPQRLTAMPQLAADTSEDGGDPVAMAAAAERRERDPGVTAVTWHPDDRRLLITFRGDLWLIDEESEPLRQTQTEARENGAAYSPDGTSLVFSREGELWSLPADPASGPGARRLTKLSQADVRIGDFRWSPDGSRIAFRLTDERQVAVRGIPDYLSEETRLVEVRRAYPGEPPVRHRIGILPAAADEAGEANVHWLDWQGVEPEMLLSYRWSPDGTRLAIDTSDLYAKHRRVYVAPIENAADPVPRMVAEDEDPFNETFYFWRIEWSTDSDRLYFLSDREQDYHVWAVDPAGMDEPRQLTRGVWAVAEIFPVEDGLIVVGNRGRPEERHLLRVDEEGSRVTRVSRRPGTHMPTNSPDGRWAAVHFSSQSTPPELLLTSLVGPADTEAGDRPAQRPAASEGGDGMQIGDRPAQRPAASEGSDDMQIGDRPAQRPAASKGDDRREHRVTRSPIPEFDQYIWVEAEFVTFESHVDGSTLHGRLTLPPDFNPARKYPAILGSVYTNGVRNQWGGRTAHPTWGLDQYLAQQGYILLNVDMRGSWGRGREHRRGIRLDYGGMDIEDLASGVRFLGTLGYVDMDRVGIWGSSYGGLMTTMSLFRKPGLYAAGIAGAPATNVWHALTGQMAVMMRPEDQPDDYADSSPFMHAHSLEDPLMIIHGMRDWVVLFKDSVVLVQRLIQLGKDVDLVVLPDAGHGWDAEGLAQTRFAFHKMVEFFDRHLRDPQAE